MQHAVQSRAFTYLNNKQVGRAIGRVVYSYSFSVSKNYCIDISRDYSYDIMLEDFLESLSEEEQRDVLIHFFSTVS